MDLKRAVHGGVQTSVMALQPTIWHFPLLHRLKIFVIGQFDKKKNASQ